MNILNFKSKLSDEEAKKLGPKDEDVEVEKFITSNTQEIETNKWLCPLSGKKFKVCSNGVVSCDDVTVVMVTGSRIYSQTHHE